jgi:mannobiose 2-epimerase
VFNREKDESVMNISELLNYKNIFDNELRNNILAYWQTYAVERNGVGFYGAVDLNNEPVLDANKSCVLTARILWAFSAAAKHYSSSEYAVIADRAFDVLTNYFADKVYGGFFMELTSDNRVHNDIKHTYAQAFVLYALSKYYQLRPTRNVKQLICKLFDELEKHTKDPLHQGYCEAFSRDWKPISENRMADNNEPRSMNTHLHVLEAYAALYNVLPDSGVEERLRDLLNIFLEKIIRESGHLGIFFDEDFNETEASKGICSFGHDIEASWLVWEAVEILNDRSLMELFRPVVTKMLRTVEREGIDKDGGLFLESVRFGSHLRTNKHWWLQAETLVGLMNGYELTGDLNLWDGVKQTWQFIDHYVIDHKGGEWFTKVNRLGQPYLVEPFEDPSPYYRNDWKVDPWKCPYHNGRACLEMISRIDRVIQSAKE